MSPSLHQFISLDLPAMATGTLAAVACALLGNFLLLRRMSLMGDAISHSVLPGLVAGFLISGSRASGPMFLGAAGAGVLTVVLVELVRRLGRVEAGAAMGVVFSVLFALGVLLIEQGAARAVDLDADCVLNGQLERVFWFPPAEWGGFTLGTFRGLPRELVTLAIVAAIATGFVTILFKELRLAAFDPGLSTSLGFPAGALHMLLMVLVAGAVVASFEAVGSILVIAMLICPPAAARLLTDRLGRQIWLSAAIAIVVGVLGYVLAAWGALWVGMPASLSAAGMMTVIAGLAVGIATVASPTHGVIARHVRRRRLATSIAREDLLGMLYRIEEAGRHERLALAQIRAALGPRAPAARAIRQGLRRDQLRADATGQVELTEQGRRAAASLIRSHRLWESYLVRELGLRPDHVHRTAMDLEHFVDPTADAGRSGPAPALDPHHRPIPPER